MTTEEYANSKEYGKAIYFLIEMGGVFRTLPDRRLVVGPGQLQALQAAGLVPKPKGARKRGENEKHP